MNSSLSIQHRVGFLVADVSGHGVPAALIAAMIKVAMQSLVHWPHQPRRGIARLESHSLRVNCGAQLVSAAYLWLDMERWARGSTRAPAIRPFSVGGR